MRKSTSSLCKKITNQNLNESIMQDINDLQEYIRNSDISSIAPIEDQYFPSQSRHSQEQMVLVPKRKLITLIEQVKLLKKAFKEQKKMFKGELESLRTGVKANNAERALLVRQAEYLNDMRRSFSQKKLNYHSFRQM